MKMSLGKKNLIVSILGGICWFVSGVFNNWDTIPAKIIVVIALIGALITSIVSFSHNIEEGDEMSDLHFMKAKSRTYDAFLFALLGILIFVSVYQQFINQAFNLNWKAWLKMFIGFQQIICGVYFIRYEKRGD